MHYCPDTNLAFQSIDHIIRNVNYGWLFKYLHANGASFFFIAVYLHIWKNLYYRKYTFLHIHVWYTGLIIFFLMIITAFLGYVLPWGQMSYWAATVITNLISAIPIIGKNIVLWIWGGYSVGNPTLTRFFSLHYLLPFIIFFFVLLHFSFLHINGSTNPSLLSSNINKHYLSLYPYFIIKDLFGLSIFLIPFFIIVFFYPEYLNHPDNYIEANPMVTPEHIVPEWYFLPFYGILRCIENKFLGVILMISSILIFFLLPIFDLILSKLLPILEETHLYNNIIHPFFINFFVSIFILLGWLGSQPMEYPYPELSVYLVFNYFFLIIFFSFFLPIIFYIIYNKK